MTGTVFIVTIYNNSDGKECVCLMNESERKKLLHSGADITIVVRPAESMSAEEIKEKLNLR